MIPMTSSGAEGVIRIEGGSTFHPRIGTDIIPEATCAPLCRVIQSNTTACFSHNLNKLPRSFSDDVVLSLAQGL